MMHFKDGLQYLNSLEVWKGGGNFKLQNILDVLERLGSPQDAIPTVHIAGTNGKGSVSAAVSSILASSGYSVGLNISPHLVHLNERININGLSASDEVIGEYARAVKAASERTVTTLSFHEAITATAFLAFKECGLDWAVMEVGLGGRLDASNVIKRPAATVIVSIDFDHQHVLGDTLAKIAKEKAGILKKGSPAILGGMSDEAKKAILEVAHGLSSDIKMYGKDFKIAPVSQGSRACLFTGEFIGKRRAFTYEPSLAGSHQQHNMAVAIATALEIGMTDENCAKGVNEVFWPGRLEHIQHADKTFILDSAHNPAGIKSFTSFLDREGHKKVDLTFGVLDTKNWKEMIDALKARISTLRLLLPESERALPNQAIIDHLSGTGIRVIDYGKDCDRLLRDILELDSSGPFFSVGSMYMIGRLRSLIVESEKPLFIRGQVNEKSSIISNS